MQISDTSDLAALVSVLVVLFAILAWVIRRWIRDQIETLVVPHLTNDEKSVAKYAHAASNRP